MRLFVVAFITLLAPLQVAFAQVNLSQILQNTPTSCLQFSPSGSCGCARALVIVFDGRVNDWLLWAVVIVPLSMRFPLQGTTIFLLVVVLQITATILF